MSAWISLFYLYDPWFFHVLRMSLIIGGIALLYLGYRWFSKRQMSLSLPLDSLFACVALCAVSCIPLFVNGTKELGVLSMYIKALIAFGLGVVIYNAFYQQNQGKTQLIRDLKLGILLQAIIGILALLGVPFVIDLAINTNAPMGGHLPRFIGSEQEYRLYNLTSSAFFPLSAFYLMLLHFLLAYHAKTKPLAGINLFLLLVIGLISGRTFLMFSVLSIVIYFRWRYLPALIAFGVLIVGLAYFYPQNIYVEHALEPIINLINGGERLSSSTDTLLNKHLFMPTTKQLLMGDGLYYAPNGWSYYGGSDSGFIRQALYGGVGYILACFVFTFYFVKRIADNGWKGSWKLVISTMLILTILNVKADTYAYPGVMFVLLMFLSLFGTSGRIKTIFYQKETAKNV